VFKRFAELDAYYWSQRPYNWQLTGKTLTTPSPRLGVSRGGFSRAGAEPGDRPVPLRLHASALQVSPESHCI